MSDVWNPDWATHPGDLLEEHLEFHSITAAELAERIGVDAVAIKQIVLKKSPVTPDIAAKLQDVFGLTSTIWMNLQRRYDKFYSDKGEAK